MAARASDRLGVLVLTACVALAAPALAEAQTGANDPPARRLEVAFAGGWLGGAALGGSDANLRTRDGGGYRLFGTDSRFGGTPTLELRAAYALTPRYAVEARAGFARPELRTSISGDVEGAPAISVAERVDQFTLEGALVVMLRRFRFRSLVPFASAGAGHLRQLHEGLTLVETGAMYHAGGGVRHGVFTRDRGLPKAAGFRGDVRLYVQTGGVELEERARLRVGASGGFYVTF